MTGRQQHGDISIRDLTPVELRSAIRALASAIGVVDALEQTARARKIVDTESVNALLSPSKWPSPDSRLLELAWLSAPVQIHDNSRIAGYSVFRSLTGDGFVIWVGRAPHRPSNKSAYLRDGEVAVAVAETYGIFLSREARRRHRMASALRYLRTIPVLVLAMIPAVMLGLLLATPETTVENLGFWDLYTIVAYIVAAPIAYGCWKLYGPIASAAAVMVAYVVWAAILTLKPGWEQEGPGLALVVPFCIAFYVVQFKHRDLLWSTMTLKEQIKDRFRGLMTIIGTMAVVAAVVFGAYELLMLGVNEIAAKGELLRGVPLGDGRRRVGCLPAKGDPGQVVEAKNWMTECLGRPRCDSAGRS